MTGRCPPRPAGGATGGDCRMPIEPGVVDGARMALACATAAGAATLAAVSTLGAADLPVILPAAQPGPGPRR